ncbi:MAG: hypothetical protein RLZZ500_2397 [Bacteroidota bacterium]|jgi:outer membrane protein TolC
MKLKYVLVLAIFPALNYAQETKTLSLKQAVEIVTLQSDEALLAAQKETTAKLEWESMKNNQYPGLKISGQYMQLTNANISSPLNIGSGVKVSSLMIGQASANMPVFNGFKLKNNIAASKSLYEAQKFDTQHAKEELALEVVELFADLYKANEMVAVFQENLKSAHQRSMDFTAMVDNGLMARNDLLKAQLQESNVQLSLDNAIKNVNIITFRLNELLNYPKGTKISIDIATIKKEMAESELHQFEGSRNDLSALQAKEQAAQKGIKIAQANYYPSLTLIGGYIALDLKDVMTVTNAMNFGVGISYDVASIFKNKKEVQLARSKAETAQKAVKILNEKIETETLEAQENYSLSRKQNQVYALGVEQANENYRIVKDKYDNSLANTNDLLEADVQQLQSKINFALSQADVALKYYQLQYTTGKLIQSLTPNSK